MRWRGPAGQEIPYRWTGRLIELQADVALARSDFRLAIRHGLRLQHQHQQGTPSNGQPTGRRTFVPTSFAISAWARHSAHGKRAGYRGKATREPARIS